MEELLLPTICVCKSLLDVRLSISGEKKNKMKTTKVKCSLFFPLSLSLRKTGLVEIYSVPHQRNIHHLDGVSELEKFRASSPLAPTTTTTTDAPARICVSDGDSIAHTTALSKWRRNDDTIESEEAKQQQQQHGSETLFQQLTSKALRADWKGEREQL